MDTELKNKWTTALRSGEYAQGTGLLRSPDDCFCCLGVLCDILDNTKWHNLEDEQDGYTWGGSDYSIDASSVALPDNIVKQLGFNEYINRENVLDGDGDPLIGESEIMELLIDLNDAYNRSFNEIADYIDNFL